MRNYLLGLLYVVTTVFSPAAIAVESILSADVIEGQATVKNYVKGNKSHFEKNASGVSSYKDAAGTSPVDGDSGTALGITCARSANTDMAGEGNLLITKTSGASRQGEGCSLNFTISPKDKAKPMRIAFDYLTAGTYVDGDLSVWIYDVTNSRVIQPSGSSILGVLISDRKVLEFQTSSDSVSYRLIWHVGVATDSANTVRIEDIEISRNVSNSGASKTEFPCIGSGTFVTSVTYTAKCWRDSNFLEMDVFLAFSGQTDVTQLFLNLPSGLTIDTSKLASGTEISELVSSGNALNTGVIGYTVKAYYNSTTTVVPFVFDAAVSYAAAAVINKTTPFTFDTGDNIRVVFRVPIVGWGSSQVQSSDTDTRVVSLNVAASASNSMTDGVTTDVIPSSPTVIDTHGGYTSGTGVYTIKIPGYYDISFYGLGNNCNLNAAERFIAYTVAGGNTYEIGRENIVTTGAQFPVASGTAKGILLKAGDTVKFQVLVDATCALSAPLIGISRQSGPAQIAASEDVNARYTNAAGTAISSSGTTIPWPTKDYDSHNAMNTSTGEYTCPISGKYHITSIVLTAATTVGTAQGKEFWALKGGSSVGQLHVSFGTNIAQNQFAGGSVTVKCLAGEILKVNYNPGVNVNLHANGDYNHIQIERVGNY